MTTGDVKPRSWNCPVTSDGEKPGMNDSSSFRLYSAKSLRNGAVTTSTSKGSSESLLAIRVPVVDSDAIYPWAASLVTSNAGSVTSSLDKGSFDPA